MPVTRAGTTTAPTPANFAAVAVLGFIWGGTFMITKLALESFSPAWVAAGRLAFAAAVLGSIWAWRGGALHPRISGSPWETGAPSGPGRLPFIVAIGLLNSVVPFGLLAWGQQYVTSAFAGVSMAAIALFVLPLAHFFVPGERLSLRRILGFAIGFAGVALLLGGDLFRSSGDPMENWGRLACLGATLSYAVSSILTRRCPPVDPVALAASTTLVGAGVALPLALLISGLPAAPGALALGALVLLGVVPTALANQLRISVVRSAGPTFMSLTNYQVPVWAMIFGALLMGEQLPSALFAALGLILAGLAISQWGALRRLFARLGR